MCQCNCSCGQNALINDMKSEREYLRSQIKYLNDCIKTWRDTNQEKTNECAKLRQERMKLRTTIDTLITFKEEENARIS